MLQTRIKNRLIRRGIVALALLAVLLGIPVAAAQTFDEAVAAYERRDYAAAIRGFRVHAEQGTAGAQAALGVIYDRGEGVPENNAEAVRWFRLAAEQGDAISQWTLGLMYARGEGVPMDVVDAYAWSSIAAARGIANATKAKEFLTRDMTQAQIVEAQNRSREYWTRYVVPFQ